MQRSPVVHSQHGNQTGSNAYLRAANQSQSYKDLRGIADPKAQHKPRRRTFLPTSSIRGKKIKKSGSPSTSKLVSLLRLFDLAAFLGEVFGGFSKTVVPCHWLYICVSLCV